MSASVTPIELDRRRNLLFRPEDIADAERNLNMESMEETLAKRGAQRLLVYLWAGLKHEDRHLTIQRISTTAYEAVKRGKTYNEFWNTVSEALVNSGWLARPTEDGAAPPTPPDPFPGSLHA